MTCRDLTDSLMAFLDGDLPAEQRVVFEKHLGACPNCVHYLHSYRQTVQLGQAAFTEPANAETMPEPLVQAILTARRAEA